jgi:hypothetical protein
MHHLLASGLWKPPIYHSMATSGLGAGAWLEYEVSKRNEHTILSDTTTSAHCVCTKVAMQCQQPQKQRRQWLGDTRQCLLWHMRGGMLLITVLIYDRICRMIARQSTTKQTNAAQPEAESEQHCKAGRVVHARRTSYLLAMAMYYIGGDHPCEVLCAQDSNRQTAQAISHFKSVKLVIDGTMCWNPSEYLAQA